MKCRRHVLTEVVIRADVSRIQSDVCEAIVLTGFASQFTIDITQVIGSIQESTRLHFDDRVRSGSQVGEFVVTIGIGLCLRD